MNKAKTWGDALHQMMSPGSLKKGAFVLILLTNVGIMHTFQKACHVNIISKYKNKKMETAFLKGTIGLGSPVSQMTIISYPRYG